MFSVSSHSTVSHSRCAYLSPDCAEKPGNATEIFMESDIKISGTQNIERSAEGARHIFMPNHSQVQRAARKDHAELCALYPLASCQAAFFPTRISIRAALTWRQEQLEQQSVKVPGSERFYSPWRDAASVKCGQCHNQVILLALERAKKSMLRLIVFPPHSFSLKSKKWYTT